jgi:hypothetical protein
LRSRKPKCYRAGAVTVTFVPGRISAVFNTCLPTGFVETK